MGDPSKENLLMIFMSNCINKDHNRGRTVEPNDSTNQMETTRKPSIHTSWMESSSIHLALADELSDNHLGHLELSAFYLVFQLSDDHSR